MKLSHEDAERVMQRVAALSRDPNPIPLNHIPPEYWRSPSHTAAIKKIFDHLNELVPTDRRFDDCDNLEEAVPAIFHYEPIHYAEIPMGDDFGQSLDDAASTVACEIVNDLYDLSEEPVNREELVDRAAFWCILEELVQTLVTLAEEYVPKLAAWGREHVNEIPESFSEEAVKELAFHVFMGRWSGMCLE